MILRTFVAASLVAFVSAGAGAETWERFRGPTGDGRATNQNLPNELNQAKTLAWKIAIPGLGNSSPVVWNDRVFVQTAALDGSDRTLLCLDAKSGKTLWSRKSPGSKAAVHQKNTLASSTPATDGKAVYIATWDGTSILISAVTMDGAPMWEKNLGEFKSQHGPGASPVVIGDKVYYALDMDKKATIFAFDKATGQEVWKQPREAVLASYCAPRLHAKGANGAELIVTSSAGITSYNPDTGKHNWNWTWTWGGKKGEPLRTVAETVDLGDMLFAFSGTSSARLTVGLKLPTAPGAAPTLAWDNKKDFPYVPSPLSRDGKLYFVNDRGFAGCFDPRSGDQVWLERLGGNFTASPVLVDGKIYAGNEEGEVFVVAAEPKFRLLAQNKIDERIRATPAVADGRIFIRGAEHLFCFGKK